jgi:hypothetical protein
MLLKALVSAGIVISCLFANNLYSVEPKMPVVTPTPSPIVKKDITVQTSRGDSNRYGEMPVSVYNELKTVGDKIGLPEYVWYPIAMYESHGDKKHHYVSKKEDSRGIFQVNIYAHEHVDKNKLYDVTYNAEIQMPELMTCYKRGKKLGLEGLDLVFYIIRKGQRPNWECDYTRNYIVRETTKYYGIISRNRE